MSTRDELHALWSDLQWWFFTRTGPRICRVVGHKTWQPFTHWSGAPIVVGEFCPRCHAERGIDSD